MWLHIMLSALAFSLAFILPEQLYMGVPIALALQWFVLYRCQSLKAAWWGGWWWGLVVFGIHLIWIAHVLSAHSTLSPIMVIAGYSFLVMHFCVMTAAGWAGGVWLTRLVRAAWAQGLVLASSMALWWLLLDLYGLQPIGFGMGYPFANPAIPMMHARWFVRLVSLVGCCMMGCWPDTTSVLPPVAYVPAVINQEYNHNSWWGTSPYEVARRLGGVMGQAVDQQPSAKTVVGPESSYPFFLNTRTEVLNLWQPYLSDRQHLFGSILWHDNKAYQAVFCCKKGLIINFYVKKYLTPFGEQTPACLTWLKNSVSDALSLHEFAPGPVEGMVETFTLDDGTTVIPRICLEMFVVSAFSYRAYRQANKPTVIYLFLNESWYNHYFKNILSSLVRLKTALIGLPVQYIGHYTCYNIRSDGTVCKH